MAIVEMKKVFLLAHSHEREKIIELLQRLGIVEIEDISTSKTWDEIGSLMDPGQAAADLADIEARLGEARYCLDFLQRHYPVRKGLLEQFTGGKISLSSDEFSSFIEQKEQMREIYLACRDAEEKLTAMRTAGTRIQAALTELEPWAGFPLPLEEIADTKRVQMQLIAVPGESAASFKEMLEDKVPAGFLQEISRGKDQVYGLLIWLAEEAAAVSALFKETAVNPVAFPDLTGTAAQNIAALEEKAAELQREEEAVISGIETLLGERTRLMACYDYLDRERARKEIVQNFARTESSFLIEGWVPSPALPDLEKYLENETETAVLVARDPVPEENVPILLENRGPAEPYEVVTRMYGYPHKNELDPTALLAPFFFLCFGICLSDAGYGIILALASYFLSRKLKLAGMGKQLLNLLFLGGISSTIFGVLMGSWFGDLIKIKPLWFNPLDDPMRMLIFSFGIGVFQIYCGMAIKAYRSIKEGKILDALFDQGGWYLFLTGLILLVLPQTRTVGQWMAIGGAAVLILTQGRSQKNPIMKFLSGLLSLYDVTGFLSDVLSYSRLLALGLATGVIATAINSMGGLLPKGPVGFLALAILLAGGHLFNLLISGLGSYVHTSRLQYIEYFGKFFDGGGKAFRPFAVDTTYVQVEEGEAPAGAA
jgi:V/A-type H+-transporting ATPase subunit I